MLDAKPVLHCVVLGGTGFVGSRVAAELRARGHLVSQIAGPRLIASSADREGALRAASAAEPHVEALARALQGSDVVINAAGLAAPDSILDGALVGANAVLPLVAARAAGRSGARRFIHLSSAAVQGNTPMLDETWTASPFSPYSQSKAWGEDLLRVDADDTRNAGTEIVVLRATSVQGSGRPTTRRLSRLARSPLASVAAPGTAPSPITSVESLADLVALMAEHAGPVPQVVLQPWEGMTVYGVLDAAGGKKPHQLPARLCRMAVTLGRFVSARLQGRFAGAVRRVELMWFGQGQVPGWTAQSGLIPRRRVADVLLECRRSS